MNLTISEAAQLMGKNIRQLRYMLKTGKLQGHKRGGQWFFDRAELPISPAQSAAAEHKLERARTVVDEALRAPLAAAEKEALERRRRFSVGRQPAFCRALPAYRQAVELLGADHPAAQAIRRALFLIVEGWHEFQPRYKTGPLRQARACLCQALTEILLTEDNDRDKELNELSETVELQVIPAVGGMLRSTERSKR